MSDTAFVLDKAADHIEEYGWTQGDFVLILDDLPIWECPACAFGAINLAAGVDVEDSNPVGLRLSASEAFVQHLGLNLDDEDSLDSPVINAIGHWNDAPGRTAEQVIAALREAAAAERGRES